MGVQPVVIADQLDGFMLSKAQEQSRYVMKGTICTAERPLHRRVRRSFRPVVVAPRWERGRLMLHESGYGPCPHPGFDTFAVTRAEKKTQYFFTNSDSLA